VFGGDAELVAVGVGHYPPSEAGNLVVLDVGASDFDDPGSGCLQIAHRSVEMEASATFGRMGHPLKCDREGSRSLRSQPNEAHRPLGDFDPEQFGPETGQAIFISGVDHNGADSGNQIFSQGASYSRGGRM
jgi:hypothetical protein